MPGAFDDDHVLHAWRVLERLVAIAFEWHNRAAPVTAIGGDQKFGIAIVDPIRERPGGEAAEDNAVRRSDSGAGEHGNRGLRNHRQVNRDPISFDHA